MSVTAGARSVIAGRMASIGPTVRGLDRPASSRFLGVSGRGQDSAHRSRSQSAQADRWLVLKLWLQVQFDAFRLEPLRYAQGVLWRARGLRVRSRNRIAALAGKSPHAYAFWIARREPQLRAALPKSVRRIAIDGFALIDCSQDTGRVEETLCSLPDELRPILIGTDRPGIVSIRSLAELAGLFAEDERWIGLFGAGDRLASGAFAAYAEAISAHPDRSVVYADDDLVDDRGVRARPHFKPDWNPELFAHHDFLTGAAMVRVRRDELSSFGSDVGIDGLVERVLDRSPDPLHLPFVLHHRRTRPKPVLPLRASPLLPADLPRVSIIVPTRNRFDLLRNCLDGLERTGYPNREIIVVDNDSDEPECLDFLEEVGRDGVHVIRIAGEFNYSALNNAAVKAAQGDILCFLNNDVEIVEPDWLGWLVEHASRPDIGAVGALLLYPDRTVQHAGVFLGIGGGAAHAHRYLKEHERGYFDRARLPQRVSAVTAACLAVSRAKFESVGGFDETNFRVAFNDIDLCLKLNERGWQSFYEPRATLIHHESKSRGSDRAHANRERFAAELAALKRIWRTDSRTDPFHHPQLSPFCEQFVIAV